ncbi:MAG TPA: hypothetical protein VMT73_07410 [Anaerolineales bacterium]|nr:hypothetical protein [Anaerolineales bacterium]
MQFYRKAADPTLIYGYPLTEEFTSKDGLKVQYFQRARFEYHPDMPDSQRVQLTPIGANLYTPSIPLTFNNPFSCRLFSETGYSVCFTFLEFFDANGGIAQFGYPVSPFEYKDDVIVQYFQYARFEWQPWNPEGQRVVLTDLGLLYFDKMGEDPGLLPPTAPLDAIIQPQVLSLQIRAFVQKAVTLSSDQQTIFIVVQDQRSQPVSGAQCTTTVRWPDGHSDSNVISVNESGVAIVGLSFSNQPQGKLIYTDVSCSFNGLSGSTTTSFRIWY